MGQFSMTSRVALAAALATTALLPFAREASARSHVAAPFDKPAAAAAVHAVNLTPCKSATGPAMGHVTILFHNSGFVRAAWVDAGPHMKTETGMCVAEQYKQLHIPSFDGDDVCIGHSFAIP